MTTTMTATLHLNLHKLSPHELAALHDATDVQAEKDLLYTELRTRRAIREAESVPPAELKPVRLEGIQPESSRTA